MNAEMSGWAIWNVWSEILRLVFQFSQDWVTRFGRIAAMGINFKDPCDTNDLQPAGVRWIGGTSMKRKFRAPDPYRSSCIANKSSRSVECSDLHLQKIVYRKSVQRHGHWNVSAAPAIIDSHPSNWR
jgi:hypothetical protein